MALTSQPPAADSMTRETLVMLPGMMCDARLFAPQIEGLERDYDILVPELCAPASIIGMAERVLDEIDFQAFWINSVTSGTFGVFRSNLPIVMANDERALSAASHMCGTADPHQVRFTLIRDTLALDRLYISPAMRAEAAAHPRLKIVGEVPLRFDALGAMTTPWALRPVALPQIAGNGLHA